MKHLKNFGDFVTELRKSRISEEDEDLVKKNSDEEEKEELKCNV